MPNTFGRSHQRIAGWRTQVYATTYDASYKEADMQPLRLDEDIRPLSEFRSGVASFVKRVNDTRRPLVLTQHGRGVAVLVDIREFEAMRERLETCLLYTSRAHETRHD